MLLSVSKVLRGYLQAVVPPPLPQLAAQPWVEIAELDSETAAQHKNKLVINLYAVEPNAYLRNANWGENAGGNGTSPLALTLHYLITYYGTTQEQMLRALGGVLQAFHSQGTLDSKNYLSTEDYQACRKAGCLPERLSVDLETPKAENVSNLWNALRQGQRLALYYEVSVAKVPPHLPPIERSPVSAARAPSVKGGTS